MKQRAMIERYRREKYYAYKREEEKKKEKVLRKMMKDSFPVYNHDSRDPSGRPEIRKMNVIDRAFGSFWFS